MWRPAQGAAEVVPVRYNQLEKDAVAKLRGVCAYNLRDEIDGLGPELVGELLSWCQELALLEDADLFPPDKPLKELATPLTAASQLLGRVPLLWRHLMGLQQLLAARACRPGARPFWACVAAPSLGRSWGRASQRLPQRGTPGCASQKFKPKRLGSIFRQLLPPADIEALKASIQMMSVEQQGALRDALARAADAVGVAQLSHPLRDWLCDLDEEVLAAVPPTAKLAHLGTILDVLEVVYSG
ncbi:unnamed protein product [Polarella glacialis]|uniref:Uncharacterized protein n=1 Tax=Polarella glacialis TaxID=89957 RepID=A0A813K797_POLGL|nr:unnamed protein product [Polarella glacialis]